MSEVSLRAVAAVLACFGSAAASAQAVPSSIGAPDQSAPQTLSAAPANGGEAAKDIIVTGSRIVRNGYTAPTPVTVAPVAQLQQTTPSNIPEALNKLPIFSGLNTTNSVATSANGNYLNLRSLGSIRTLILLDGHRNPPTNSSGQVDTNTLPQMLVQRVDVVTGGASAIYGSDAVSGVVNFVLDRHFQGLKAVAQSGISTYGDAPSYRFGIAGGTSFADGRGHIIASVEHFQSKGIQANEDRPYLANVPVYAGAGTAASPYTLLYNGRIATSSYGGLVSSGPFKGQQFVTGSDGQVTLAPFNPGTPTPIKGISVGGDGSYFYGTQFNSDTNNSQGFTRAEYELTPSVTAYAQLSLSQAETASHGRVQLPLNYTIFSGNPFLPQAAQAQLTATNTASFTVSRNSQDLALQEQILNRNRYISALAGFTGKLFDRFTWDVYYDHSDAYSRVKLTNNLNYPRFFAALDAVRDPSGNTVCRVTLTNPGLYPGCVPINLFGLGNASPAAQNYIRNDSVTKAHDRQEDAGFSISGNIFNDWAGPVSLALSGEYRTQSLVQTTNSDPNIVPDFSGLRLGSTTPPTLVYANNVAAPLSGSYNVWEVAAEAVVPLIKDSSFTKSLELSLAGRYTRYSTSGSAPTWKVGATWVPIDGVRFRASDSKDIRAPTLSDLFSGLAIQTSSINDPHTGVSSVVLSHSSGNPNLVPEVSHTFTAGVVLTPAFVPRFSISVDYYNIRINNAIGAINGSDQGVLAECESSGGTSPVCAQIVRPLPFSDHSAANFPLYVLSSSLNAAKTSTNGIDVESSYNFQLASLASSLPGRIDLRVLYTYQPHLKTQAYPTSVIIDQAGANASTSVSGANALAKHRVSGFVTYAINDFSINWQGRFQSKMLQDPNPLLHFAAPPLGTMFLNDVALDFAVHPNNHEFHFFVAVDNIFNRAPRISPPANTSSRPGFSVVAIKTDDAIGRYFTAGVRVRF